MTPEQAADVRARAWTDAMRQTDAAYPHGWYGICPCQAGICGACSGASDNGRPRHDRCISRGRGPIPTPSYVADRRGFVLATLLTGCAYLCPCGCWNDPAKASPPPPRRPERPRPAPAPAPARKPRRTRPPIPGQAALDIPGANP